MLSIAFVNVTVELFVECRRIGVAKHQGQLIRVSPVGFLPELIFHLFIKNSTGQRIGNRNADLVWQQFVDHPDGFPDIFLGFSRVTELNKERRMDTILFQQMGRFVDLSNHRAFIHRIQYLLRTAFRSAAAGKAASSSSR